MFMQHLFCHQPQIFNLFLGAGKLVVDLGYNARSARELRDLVTDVLHRLEVSGGPGATAAVRRYCRGHDPVVSNEVQDRAAARATRKAQEIAYSTAVPVEQLAAFKPFTLM